MDAIDMITKCMTLSDGTREWTGTVSTGDEIETASEEVRAWLVAKRSQSIVPEEPMGNGSDAPAVTLD